MQTASLKDDGAASASAPTSVDVLSDIDAEIMEVGIGRGVAPNNLQSAMDTAAEDPLFVLLLSPPSFVTLFGVKIISGMGQLRPWLWLRPGDALSWPFPRGNPNDHEQTWTLLTWSLRTDANDVAMESHDAMFELSMVQLLYWNRPPPPLPVDDFASQADTLTHEELEAMVE